jgi:catechol 2,3-dioxygenase-like lactoylglutathione lyase family enzyme
MAVNGLFYIEAFVSNLERSKDFYGSTLGWKLNTDLAEVAGFFFGTGYLVILSDNRPPESRTYAGGMYVEVQVDDAASEHKRLLEAGVQVSEISDKPWGERKFTFSDPDGYTWAYGQQTQGNV